MSANWFIAVMLFGILLVLSAIQRDLHLLYEVIDITARAWLHQGG